MPVLRVVMPGRVLRPAGVGLLCAWLGLAASQPAPAASPAAATAPTAAPSAPSAPSASAAETEPSFDILEFEVQGNTVLDTVTIERAVYPHLGQGRTLNDVEAARKSLEAAYRLAGYGLAVVDIPEQGVADGVIRLQVTEGRISRIRVTGARYFSQGYILERVEGVAQGQVPHLPSVQAQLLDVNRSGDRRVTPVFRPGLEPGTTEVDFAVEDKLPIHASVAVNNAASPNTTATRLQASVSYDNLFQRDHSLSLQWVTSPEKSSEVNVASLAYSVPMGQAGLESLAFTLTRSDSQVYAALGNTTAFGKGTAFGVRRSYVLNLSESNFQLLTLGAEYKDMQDTVMVGDIELSGTPIRFMPLSLSWTSSSRADKAELQLGATLTGGVSGLVNRQQQFANKRYKAKATYAFARLDFRHTQTLPWFGLRLRTQADTQMAPDPLISNEQYVIGGTSSVRGYYEAEAVGDLGLRGSLQLDSADFATGLGWKWLSSFNLRTFVDGAAAELRDPLPGQARRFRLLGSGFGLQASSTGSYPVSLSLDAAWPLLKRGTVGSEGLRLHMSASVGF